MNESCELTPDANSCNLVSIIPNLGMSSCRGRAEAFARSLSSKLRTLGTQNDDECAASVVEDQSIINGGTAVEAVTDELDGAVGISEPIKKNWLRHEACFEQKLNVTDRQAARHDTDSFFDFDCELESPGSPADECEYSRLIETTSNTPHNSIGEPAYACTSSPSSSSPADDGTFYNIVNTEDSQLNITLTKQNELEPQVMDIEETAQNNSNEIKEIAVEIATEEDEIKCDEEVTENLAKDVTLSYVKIEYELAKNSTITTNNNNNKNEINVAEIQFEKSDIKAEIVDIKTETEIIPTTTTITTTTTTTTTDENKDKENSSFTHSGLDTTDDEDECRPQRVRRCSSLKTGKTPPGTPGRKKIVRFADKLGLDLADIKTFLDEIPNIPKSAFEDLEINEPELPMQLGSKSDKLLVPLFQQPGGLPTFLDMVRERQVSLENAAVTDHINQTITGSVRVRNLDFHKSVHIRYTLDHWRSYADLQANYVQNSCDGFSDKFSFILFGNSMQVGQRLELAVRFQCKGQQFWDNNYGINYCFQCLPSNNNSTTINTIASTITTTNIFATIPMNINNNKLNSYNHHYNNNHHHHHHHNNNKNTLLQQNNVLNRMGKPQNGVDTVEHNESQVLRLLSPTADEAWCGSFY